MHVNNIDWNINPFRADEWFEIGIPRSTARLPTAPARAT